MHRQECGEIGLRDANRSAEPVDPEQSQIDPTSNRSAGDVETLCDLHDREELDFIGPTISNTCPIRDGASPFAVRA
jgi:hypothetical protein